MASIVTMNSLCKSFEKLAPDYTAELDTIESYDGYWVVYITNKETKMSARYVFESAEDFVAWGNGVVFD